MDSFRSDTVMIKTKVHIGASISKMCVNHCSVEQTYTCSLLHGVQDVFGWDQKVQQAPQGVSLITTFNDLEKLAEKSGCRGIEGRVQHRQQVLDGVLQRVWVLKIQEGEVFQEMFQWKVWSKWKQSPSSQM